MPPEIGGKWGTECLNTRFPTLLYAGYSVKLKKIINIYLPVVISEIDRETKTPNAVVLYIRTM